MMNQMIMKYYWIIVAALAAFLSCMASGAGCGDAQAAQPDLPDKALVRFGDVKLFHGASVTCVTFTPDGREIVAAGGMRSQGGAVSIWSAATGKLVRTMAGPSTTVASMALSGDGKSIILAGVDRSVQFVWFPSGKPVRDPKSLALRGNWVGMSPNGLQLAVSDGMKLTVIDLATGKTMMTVLKGTGAAFSRDGRYLAVVSTRDMSFGIELWDVSLGVRVRRFDSTVGQRFTLPAFSPNGKLLVAGSMYGSNSSMPIWNTLTGKIVKKLPVASRYVAGVVFSPDGKRVAVADRLSSLRVLDVESGKALSGIASGVSRLYSVAFSPDGSLLAGGDSSGQIHVWETDKFTEPMGQAGHTGPVVSVDAGDNGRVVATSGHDGTVFLWDGRTGRKLHRLEAENRQPSLVSVSRDGALAAVCDNSANVQIWRTDTGKQFRRVGVPAGVAKLVTFLPTGRELVAISPDVTMCRIDIETGQAEAMGSGGASQTSRISLAANARLAVSYYQNLAVAWSLRDGRKLGVCPMPGVSNLYGLAVSPSARLLAGDAGQRVAIVELDSGRLIRSITRFRKRVSVSVATFSPDGRVLALADADWTATLWSVRTGRQLGQLAGHRGQITSMRFMPDGKRLLTGSTDGTAIMWDMGDVLADIKPTTAPARRDDLTGAWEALAEEDAAKADEAYYKLVAGGTATVGLLAEEMLPAEGPAPARVRKLLTDLGDEQYGVRKQATDALAQLGPLVEPALRRVESSTNVEEIRLRVRQLLTSLDNPRDRTGKMLRQLRAVLVLEEIATPQAAALLKKLAAGAPGAHLTRRANETLERIHNRTPA